MSYRLKGSEGPCRLLQYAHDSKSLFFTDSIHNTVQTYNIPEGRVTDAGLPHPSPVTAFSISSDSNLILSCSESPPIVQLHNRLLGTTATIVPQASTKPVITCTFHPSRKHTFILAFKDGIVAAYDSTRLVRAKDTNPRKPKGPSQVADHIHKFEHLHDPSVSGNPGITAIQFIPGYKAKAVSVGEDGRAFVLDFEQKDVQASWHVGAPMTSLSIRSHEDYGWLAAVGTVHGMCLVYDSEGKKLCDRAVDAEGSRILGVEWISGEVRLPQLLENERQAEKMAALPGFRVEKPISKGKEKEQERERQKRSDSPQKLKERILKEQSNSRQPSDKLSPVSSDHKDKIEEPLKERKPRNEHKERIEELARERKPKKHREESPPKDDIPLKRVDSRPPKLPEFQTEHTNLQEVVDTYTSDYMSMFSPVKKTTALTQASSLPERKPNKARGKSDPKEQDGDLLDVRSALSAPELWNEKIEASMRPPPSTIQPPRSPTKSQPRAEDHSQPAGIPESPSRSKEQNTKISIRPTSPPRTDKKDAGFKPTSANDISLLSEIRNIRSGNIPKRNGPGLSLFAPYMPSRSGNGNRKGDDSILRPELASAAKKAIAESSQLLEKTTMQSSPGPLDGATGLLTSPPAKDSEIEDLSDDGDIWLAAEAACSSNSSFRKRKGSESGAVRPGGLARTSAKKTKTNARLHWDSTVGHERSSPAPQTEYSTFLDTTYNKSPRQDLALVSSPNALPLHSDDNTYKLAKLPFQNDSGSNSAMSNELEYMRKFFQAQFTTLQLEMAKEFRAQRKLLESVKREMAILRADNETVWKENERLKLELKRAKE